MHKWEGNLSASSEWSSKLRKFTNAQLECRSLESALASEAREFLEKTMMANRGYPIVIVEKDAGSPYLPGIFGVADRGKKKVLLEDITAMAYVGSKFATQACGRNVDAEEAINFLTCDPDCADSDCSFTMMGLPPLLRYCHRQIMTGVAIVNPYYDFSEQIRSSLPDSIDSFDIPSFAFKLCPFLNSGFHIVDEIDEQKMDSEDVMIEWLMPLIKSVFYGSTDEALAKAKEQYLRIIRHAFSMGSAESKRIMDEIASTDGVYADILTDYGRDCMIMPVTVSEKSGKIFRLGGGHHVINATFVGSSKKAPKISKSVAISMFDNRTDMLKFDIREYGEYQWANHRVYTPSLCDSRGNLYLKPSALSKLPRMKKMKFNVTESDNYYQLPDKVEEKYAIDVTNMASDDIYRQRRNMKDGAKVYLILSLTKGSIESARKIMVDEAKVATSDEFDSFAMDVMI
jgi:hypothetical protein